MDEFGMHTPWTKRGERLDGWMFRGSTDSSNIYRLYFVALGGGTDVGRGVCRDLDGSIVQSCDLITRFSLKMAFGFWFSVLICLYVDTFLLKLCCRTRLGIVDPSFHWTDCILGGVWGLAPDKSSVKLAQTKRHQLVWDGTRLERRLL